MQNWNVRLCLGHEFAGELENGQRVAVDPAISCGHCELMSNMDIPIYVYPSFLRDTEPRMVHCASTWHGMKNAFSPFLIHLTFEDGAMLEPLGVAIHAVDLAHLKAGMTVGVFGCGPIGLLIIQMAKLAGAANIIATDKLPHRVEAAKALGADHAFLAGDNSRA